MQTLELQPESWRDYFHAIGGGLMATVQRLSENDSAGGPRLTCQPLQAIEYDPYQDVIELAVGRKASHGAWLRYFVSDPWRITVTESDGSRAIVVDDRSGVQTFIGLFDLAHRNA
jgi:hypothetical protein